MINADMNIENAGFSQRALCALITRYLIDNDQKFLDDERIITFRDFENTCASDLMQIHNFGLKTLHEIICIMDTLGLSTDNLLKNIPFKWRIGPRPIKRFNLDGLKDCPFCYSEAECRNDLPHQHWVLCLNKSNGPPCGGRSGYSETREGAVTAWNRRKKISTK
jgi:hypothetical protein